ncbi:MAG TPA: NAD/NADP octopine/nopaline dehydrogenase, partial [Synergistaceae bacterium]|nr:NAD/NADP octopine/nopaline dehydrogenase [Synergistaceae bacterium]
VRGRYLTEDVPGVVAPVSRIAEKAGFRTPLSSLVVDLASQLHGTDYWTCGTTLESLGIGDKSIDEILDMMR